MRRAGRAARRLVRCVAVAALLCLATHRAQALINPNFTPIHLTRQSAAIVSMTVQAAGDAGALRATVVEAVKGQAPAGPFALRVDDEVLRDRIRDEVLPDADAVAPALAFFSKDEAGGAGASGVVSLDGHWFSIAHQQSGAWLLAEDTADMKAVWDGSTAMLLRCVKYVMADPDPLVPVRVGATWAAPVQAGRVEGACAGMMAVDLAGDGSTALLVLSEGGDRLLEFDAKTKAFRDGTAGLKLATRSRSAAVGDFNGDGRIDVASYDGQALAVVPQAADGTFGAPTVTPLPGGCTGLCTLDAGILVSTQAMPALVADGKLRELVPTAGGEFPGAKLGAARACVAADFDGDAVADVVQPFEEGALFYKGAAASAFEPPRPCGNLYSGQGRAQACPGDLDADGRLDLLITGQSGQFLWLNAGGGRFEADSHVGEPDYIATDDNSAGAVGDLNGDGRQDFVIFYRRSAPHPFFSRGFATFGFAKEMDLAKGGLFPQVSAGQQTGCLADVNGDGGQDLATVLADGTVWVVMRDMESVPGLCVRATVSADAGYRGPLTVTGWDGARCLGAWNVQRGGSEAFFARATPGPLTLKWQFPGAAPQEARAIVESGPVRVELGPKGIARTDGG